jgi:hypothetical protein
MMMILGLRPVPLLADTETYFTTEITLAHAYMSISVSFVRISTAIFFESIPWF